MKKSLLLLLSGLMFIVSCEKEAQVDESFSSLDRKASLNKGNRITPEANSKPTDPDLLKTDPIIIENLRTRFLQDDPGSTCMPTDLAYSLLNHLDQLMSDPVAGDLYASYINLNRNISLRDTTPQYFGKNGEYTKLVEKRIRELERFWDMEGELLVKGQHSETLNDRDKLAAYFYSITFDDRHWEDAYIMADDYMANNERSPYLPESPLFSGDGFANTNNTIVIGDGLVQILSETGIAPEIIWTGILAHEWSHQVQIRHALSWYDSPSPFSDVPLMQLELEADFFAAYFLTHKRGATYNWKRVEQFLDLFFQTGDCAVGDPRHHGTPQQRLLASRLGYELAASAQKKGHILTPAELHEAFLALLPVITDDL